jgi:hypothetical protein
VKIVLKNAEAEKLFKCGWKDEFIKQGKRGFIQFLTSAGNFGADYL